MDTDPVNHHDLFRALHHTNLPDAEIDAIEEAAQDARCTRMDSCRRTGSVMAYAVWHKGHIIGYVDVWAVTREGRGRWANSTVEAREYSRDSQGTRRAKRKDAVIDILVRYSTA